MTQKPEVLTFLIADQVIQEKNTNKWSAIGIFDHIYSDSFPLIHPNFGLYVKLTDAQGEYKIHFEITDSAHQKIAVFEGLNLRVDSPLVTIDFGIQTRNLHIPKPDHYHVDLFFNGQMCKSLPFVVIVQRS